jgi:pimeloyl-ACP methyl ester carboxylesterase
MEKTIVLLHGFGEDHRIFKKQLKVLSEKYKVFAPDLPGSGTLNYYEFPANTESIEWLAAWVKDQLDAQKIEQCILLGHSMGGYITLAFAEKYPEYLTGWGLIHSTAYADSEAKKETRRKAIDFMKEKGAHTFLRTAIPGLFGADFLDKHKEKVDLLIEDAKSFTSPSLEWYYRAMIARPDRSDLLRNAKVPVLMVAGTEDKAAPIEDIINQASIPSICHFHILQQTGHMGMLEAPDNLSIILLNFIAAV